MTGLAPYASKRRDTAPMSGLQPIAHAVSAVVGKLPNRVQLRERWLVAERAWRAAVRERGLDLYSTAAEGETAGRGAKKAPVELRSLFDARERALDAYQAAP